MTFRDTDILKQKLKERALIHQNNCKINLNDFLMNDNLFSSILGRSLKKRRVGFGEGSPSGVFPQCEDPDHPRFECVVSQTKIHPTNPQEEFRVGHLECVSLPFVFDETLQFPEPFSVHPQCPLQNLPKDAFEETVLRSAGHYPKFEFGFGLQNRVAFDQG